STLTSHSGRLAVMYAGRIVEEGPSGEAFRHAAHPYTAALAEAFPVIGDPAFRLHPSGLAGDPPDPRDLPSGCPFHPRCPVVREDCPTAAVELWPVDERRRAACVRVLDNSWRRV
ncbi:MAG TPA: oligopeptide/dipeptide ABC transporter ATP-binding protein, partial [Gaiellaceae bacterium]|nr:oligopeptide/dipeptide ABC transporter ATP-binding protein [Gaiellaceae bacterium]